MEVEDTSDSKSKSNLKASVASRITFANVATLMDKIVNSQPKDKQDRLKAYLSHIRTNYRKAHGSLDPSKANNDSLYCIIRILLPTEDRGRGPYNIRGPTLGKIFARILGVDAESEDGKKLIFYKDPEKSGSAGNLPTIIFSILERRFSGSASSNTNRKKGPSLAELHEVLDSIVKNDQHKQNSNDEKKINIEDQCKILRSFIQRISPLEGKWLANILLKQSGLGLSKKQIFKSIHPQAQDLYDKTRNLEQVCIRLNDPDTKLDSSDSGIQLFSPFKPMLSSRLLRIVDGDSDEVQNKVKTRSGAEDCDRLPSPPFYVEIKWDGERFQIHYDSSKPINDRFRYFSRNSFDCTVSFNLTLTPRLKMQIQGGCDSFILDGEMMAWRYSSKSFTQKGANIDVKKMKADNPNHCPAFVAYDLVYFNGDDVTARPLKERMEILRVKKLVIEPLEGVIILSEQRIVHSAEQVNEALNNAVDDSEEGLMVKAIHSTYEIGQRGAAWLKAKPEYYDPNSVDDLDLIILGGYYSESTRKSGSINHFLVGLIDKSKCGKEEFYPVARIQSRRLKDPEMEELVKQLETQLTRNENPGFNIHFKGKKRPDLFINPKKSIVVQVKASEIIYNAGSALQYTLRFPRITAIRQDKSWQDIMTLKEFHALRVTYGGKLACRSDGLSPPKPTFGNNKTNKVQGPNLSVRTTTTRASKSASPASSVFRNQRETNPRKQYESEDDSKETVPQTSASVSYVSPKHFNIPSASPYKSKNKSPSLSLSSRAKPSNNITLDIFDSRIFLVIGFAEWKTKTETLIKQYGGAIVQNPTKNLFVIVAEIVSMKVQNFIKQGKYDIVKLCWIENCIESGKIVNLVPEHLWFAGPETEKVLSESFDAFGDSYTKTLTSVEMKALLNSVMKKMDEGLSDGDDLIEENESQIFDFEKIKIESQNSSSDLESQNSCKSIASFSHKPILKRVIDKELEDEEDAVKLRKYNFFDGCKIAFREGNESHSDEEETQTAVGNQNKKQSSKKSMCIEVLQKFQLSIQIEFYGGKVAASEEEDDVTHVLVFDQTSPSKAKHLAAHVVKGKWLLDCLDQKSIVEELYYMVH